MTVVVDVNIVIAASFADEPLNTQAKQLLAFWGNTNISLAAPRLFRSELTTVIRKAVFQQRITHSEGRTLVQKLLLFPIELVDDDDLLKSAYELAHRFNRPRAYDTQYLALAQRLTCDFWTTDKPLFNAVRGNFSGIHWLGDWQPAP